MFDGSSAGLKRNGIKTSHLRMRYQPIADKEKFTLIPVEIENGPGKQTLTFDPKEFYAIVEHHPDAYIKAVNRDGDELQPLTPTRPLWEALYSEQDQREHFSEIPSGFPSVSTEEALLTQAVAAVIPLRQAVQRILQAKVAPVSNSLSLHRSRGRPQKREAFSREEYPVLRSQRSHQSHPAREHGLLFPRYWVANAP